MVIINSNPKEEKGSIPVVRNIAMNMHKALVVRQVAINQNQPHGREYNELENILNNLLIVFTLAVPLSQKAFWLPQG